MWEVFGYLRASYEYSEIENFVWLSLKLKEKWEKKSCVFIFKLFSVVCLVKELEGYFKKCVLNYSHSRTEYKYNPKGKKAINIRSLACVAGACKEWAQEKTGAREGDTRGERKRLHGRPPKIVSRPLSNYLAAVAWSVTSLTPCVSPSRAPVPSFARYFQAPATQAIRSQGSQLYQRDFFPKLEVRWNLQGKIMIFESKFAKRKGSNERGKIRALRWAYMVDNWLTMACKLVVIKAIGKLGTTSGRSYLYIEELQRGLTTLSYEWWNEIYETWAWVLIAWL